MSLKFKKPPRFAHRFFRWYCHPKLRDSIEGDLMELYEETREKSGKKRADLKFMLDVILLFRPGIIRPAEGTQNLNTYGMYKSYVTVGWRNLLRNRGYAFINISGLALGMTVAILNGLWIWDELSFDRHFANHKRIAAVSETGKNDEGQWVGTTMTYPLGTELLTNYKQHFDNLARTTFERNIILVAGDTRLSENGLYADPSITTMLALKMKLGTPKGLADPQSLFISGSLAKKIFGDGDPINQVIRFNNKSDVTVTGVYEDFPRNTSFANVHFFATWDLYLLENKWIEQRAMTNWRNHFIKIYAQIPEQATFEGVTEKVKSAIQFAPEDQEDAIKSEKRLMLYPMSQWHLHPYDWKGPDEGPMQMIRLVGTIGAFVLLLACINFMNLSTARSERRAKEVGIRKTIGSQRKQLISQFLSESFLVVLFAFVLALIISALALPAFNDLAAKDIAMPWANVFFWLFSLGFVTFTSIVAGSYPAFYLSQFNPVKVLKGSFRVGRLASLPRKVLVVAQFSISVVLIVATIIVYQQIQYTKNRPVGYDREGLLMLRKKSNDFYGKYELLRNELTNTGVVEEVSESMGSMAETASGNNGWAWSGREPMWEESFVTLSVSHTHGKTVGWQFVDGRDFNVELPGDSSGIIINESAARFMNLQKPVGEHITWTWWENHSKVNEYKILGVIKDVVMDSPYDEVEPAVFYLKGHNGTPSWINIRINPNVSASEALPKIERVFRKVTPSAPFEYQFADETYATKFAAEERIGKLASVFTVLAMFISCLGLLGLASFVAETRTKEIGIRKVLGASVSGLWRMLSKDFVWLVVIACIVAIPIAYYLMNEWLEKFVYRTDVSVWVFVATGLGAIGITLLTVSYQSIKAAMMNPVKSLRSE